MHNRAKVIFPDQVGHQVTLHSKVMSAVLLTLKIFVSKFKNIWYLHIKVMSAVLLNVVIVDGDVLVSVPAGVLVPEPDSMHQLMDHTVQKFCGYEL